MLDPPLSSQHDIQAVCFLELNALCCLTFLCIETIACLLQITNPGRSKNYSSSPMPLYISSSCSRSSSAMQGALANISIGKIHRCPKSNLERQRWPYCKLENIESSKSIRSRKGPQKTPIPHVSLVKVINHECP